MEDSKMTVTSFLNDMKNRLDAKECDFLIDLIMATRTGQVEKSAETFGVNARTVVTKLGAQADLIEGVQNGYNND